MSENLFTDTQQLRFADNFTSHELVFLGGVVNEKDLWFVKANTSRHPLQHALPLSHHGLSKRTASERFHSGNGLFGS